MVIPLQIWQRVLEVFEMSKPLIFPGTSLVSSWPMRRLARVPQSCWSDELGSQHRNIAGATAQVEDTHTWADPQAPQQVLNFSLRMSKNIF